MTKIIVTYDSKYGNTKRAAETIAKEMKDIGGAEISVSNTKEVNINAVATYDVLVLGAPNHMASPSRTMLKFVDRLAELNLRAKNVAVFGTYSGRLREPDRAVRKMEKKVKEKLPKIGLITPSLSVRVYGVPGPIVEGELERCREFGKRIANQVKQEQ